MPTVANIRGTSGSGKSTLVRKLLEEVWPDNVEPVMREGRRKPAGYRFSLPGLSRRVFVAGHYETACGGCDTLPNYDTIVQLVTDHYDQDFHVVFEGLLISADVKQARRIHEHVGEDLHILALDTPLGTCIDSVNERRRAKNPDAPPVNPANTELKHKGVRRSCELLGRDGVRIHHVSRESGYDLLRKLLHAR